MAKKKAAPVKTSRKNALALKAAVAKDEAKKPVYQGPPIGEAAYLAWLAENQA